MGHIVAATAVSVPISVDVFGVATIGDTLFVTIGLVTIVVLLALSGFFSSSEIEIGRASCRERV